MFGRSLPFTDSKRRELNTTMLKMGTIFCNAAKSYQLYHIDIQRHPRQCRFTKVRCKPLTVGQHGKFWVLIGEADLSSPVAQKSCGFAESNGKPSSIIMRKLRNCEIQWGRS